MVPGRRADPPPRTEATRGAIAQLDGTLWPYWSWDGDDELWAGKYKTTGHGSLIVTNPQGRITFVSDPVTGNQHDMAKLKGSVVEKILKKAGGVFGDKGFIGTEYITTPIRRPQCRQLLQWEHAWNNQVSSFRAPVERAVATLKAWRITLKSALNLNGDIVTIGPHALHGARNDAIAFCISGLKARLEQSRGEGNSGGDLGYTGVDGITIVPFRKPRGESLLDRQKHFNAVFSVNRRVMAMLTYLNRP